MSTIFMPILYVRKLRHKNVNEPSYGQLKTYNTKLQIKDINYKEKQRNDNPKFSIVFSSRKEQYDITEWHIRAVKGAQNTLVSYSGW